MYFVLHGVRNTSAEQLRVLGNHFLIDWRVAYSFWNNNVGGNVGYSFIKISLLHIKAPAAMVNSQEKNRRSTPRTLERQIDKAIGNHQTSASMINAIVGGVSSRGIISLSTMILLLADRGLGFFFWHYLFSLAGIAQLIE